MEAQLDSPQQGQLGASVGGRDYVRQACIGKQRLTETTQREAKYLMFSLISTTSARSLRFQ